MRTAFTYFSLSVCRQGYIFSAIVFRDGSTDKKITGSAVF